MPFLHLPSKEAQRRNSTRVYPAPKALLLIKHVAELLPLLPPDSGFVVLSAPEGATTLPLHLCLLLTPNAWYLSIYNAIFYTPRTPKIVHDKNQTGIRNTVS